MATDVPFWRKSTGAEQRIATLVQYLSSQSVQVRTFYLGQTGSAQYTERDHDLIAQSEFDVEQRSSDQPPQGLARKLGWYADATLNQLKQITATESDGTVSSQEHTPPSLEDYRWPWAMTAFADSVTQFEPNSILIQYIKLAYLLDSLSNNQSEDIQTIVDTHDVLHLRAEQFRQRGLAHWIELTREEEASQLKKFDSILAIQPSEAKIFAELAPDSETIICGHGASTDATSIFAMPARNSSQPIRIGYLASNNAANGLAIENFIEQVWPDLSKSNFELVVAGSVCNWLEDNNEFDGHFEGANMLGHVEELSDFYDQVDVVINPVEFGTGLKIKNCEAISFGKPLLTTPHGFEGMPAESLPAILICNSLTDFKTRLLEMKTDRNVIARFREAATELAQTFFSAQQAYSPLKQLLERHK